LLQPASLAQAFNEVIYIYIYIYIINIEKFTTQLY
jgi:hypothetical protein